MPKILHITSHNLLAYGISYINLLILANCSNLIYIPTCTYLQETCIQTICVFLIPPPTKKNLFYLCLHLQFMKQKKTNSSY